MQTENENVNQRPETPVMWNGGWQKVYAAAARAIGHECTWAGSGRLCIKKDGKLVGYGAPAERGYFLMSSFIKAVEDQQLVRAERSRKREEERLALQKSMEEPDGATLTFQNDPPAAATSPKRAGIGRMSAVGLLGVAAMLLGGGIPPKGPGR